MENIKWKKLANVRYDKKYKNAIYATEDKNMISVDLRWSR